MQRRGLRIELDALRKIQRAKLPRAYKRLVWRWLFLILFFTVLINMSFWGTIGALEIKERADVLKLVQSGRYLILFQNNAEMRPTGGFIGSFAVAEFQNYKLKNFDFNTNIFKLDNAFIAQNAVAPPAPLAKVSQNHWSLHDSNFSVDFPEAAQTIRWFYEQESGQKVDGVIAFNASTVQNLLRLTGPIYLEKYQTNISADNFFEELAQKIEKEYFYDAQNHAINEPKTILKDMMPILLEKAKKISKTQLIKLVLTELTQKQILIQSDNREAENLILSAGWGGQVLESDSDYLYVNNANITDTLANKNAGAKTSLKMKEAINYQVTEKNGGLVSNLTLTRSHTGSYLWPDGVNTNWTRILVPRNSVLTKAELNGQDITDKIEIGIEAGKTYFGLWINTAPQTSNVLKLTYQLPITASNYHLTTQKQPGNLGDELNVRFKNKVLFDGILDRDLAIK